MTGKALYELHMRAFGEQQCLLEPWEDILESERMAWTRTAELLWGAE